MRMAAIYARVSSEQQREENTIASQTASLTVLHDCPSDTTPNGGNGVVNIDDLLWVINHWG